MNTQSMPLNLRSGLRLLGSFFSFECVFILFLISVNYKADPRFAWLSIDSTIIFFGLGVAMGLVIIYREGIYLPGLAVASLLIVFIAWAMLTDLWTPSRLYAHEKLFKLVTLNLWTLVATAMIIANRRERICRFLVLVLVFGTAAALDGIIQYATTERFALSASFRLENYLGQGRFYGMGGLVAFAAWLHTSPFSRRGMVLMAFFVTCFYGLLITGGRGPTLAVLAAMLLPLALGLRFFDQRLLVSKAVLASIALFIVMAVVLLPAAANFPGELPTLQRFGNLLTEEEAGQSARLDFWIGSWRLWLEHPVFGSGVGSWPILYHGRDVGWHPHNLILEVLVEFGLVGLLLLATVPIAAARRTSLRRLREDPVLMCIAMLCINTFLAAMTSSDITGNRNVFAMFGLLMMRPYTRTSYVDTRSSARNLSLREGMPNPGRGGM